MPQHSMMSPPYNSPQLTPHLSTYLALLSRTCHSQLGFPGVGVGAGFGSFGGLGAGLGLGSPGLGKGIGGMGKVPRGSTNLVGFDAT